ncbi:MAG: T9SS type A sorting domain-containing protein [Flavobacteriales bacterium]|nr:MAG: T9SS type A sorting domain-containing protein [Flavobacteriales bacterium]
MQRPFTLLLAATAITLAAAQSPTLVGYEYWFDQNDADRTYVPVTPAQTVDLDNAPLNTSGLALGPHVVHLRWKDQGPGGSRRWSPVVTRALHVGQPGPWEIVAVRYWVGNPTNGADPLVRTKVFTTPQTELSFNGLLELCGYPTGAQTLRLQLLDNHGQWSSVVTRPVNITPAGDLGLPTISASTSTICPGDVVTFTATPPSGPGFATPTSYTWQVPSGNGWSTQPSDSASIVVTIGDVSGTIQVTPSNLCGTGPTASLAVGIAPPPDQPGFITGPLQACAGSTVAFGTPAVPGLTYAWSITGGWTASGGPDAAITTTIGTADATISVTPFNACGVAGPSREAAITVTAPPNAGINGALTVCSNSAPVNLFTGLQGMPDSGGEWRFENQVVPSVYNPAINEPGAYTYTVTGTGPCPDATASVTVSETPAPDAGMDAALSLCSSDGPQDMTSALNGSPDSGGSWSGPSSTNGLFDPTAMSAGVYTYTVTGAPPCANASATLTISLDQAPSAGIGGVLELCTGEVPVLLLNALGGSPALNGTWTGPDGAAFVGIFTPGQSAEGVYTYTVLGSGACADVSAELEVNVMDLQLIEMNGPTAVPIIEQLLFWVLPTLADADSILWTLPAGWSWGPDDSNPYDASAYVIPDADAGAVQVCAQAFGGGCVGNEVCLALDVTVGMGEPEAGMSRLQVFPNPSKGRFVIRMDDPPAELDVRVHDMLGKVVGAFQYRSGDLVLELGHLAAGTYLLQWRSSSHNGHVPVIVAR